METWFSGIVTSIIATLFLAACAAALTWVKSRWPRYGDLALFWFASAACFCVLWLAFTGYRPFSKVTPQVTAENIEAYIKAWSEELGMGFVKASAPDSYFAYTVSTRTNTPIQIARLRNDKPAYLQLTSTVMFAPEHQAALSTLTKDQIDTIFQEIALELNKTRVGFTIATLGLPQTGTNSVGQTAVVLQRAALITSVNEVRYTELLDDMEFAVQLTRVAASLSIKRATSAQGRPCPPAKSS
jgi:hypothetical protein